MAIVLTSNASNFTSTSATVSCVLPAINAGDIVVVLTFNGASGTLSSIGDSAGVLSFGAARAAITSGVNAFYEYTAKASAAATNDTITVTYTTSGGNWLSASAWSGLAASGWFDPNASLPATNGSAAQAFSTSNADDLLIAALTAPSQPRPGAGSGWTSLLPNGSGANYYWQVEYQIVTAKQSNLTPTMTGDTPNSCIADALMQASVAAAYPFRRSRTYLGR